MNYLDIIIFLPLIYGIVRGFSKGFVIEVATLAALVLGIYGALKFSSITSEFLMEQFDLSGRYLPIISFAITFVLIVVAINLLGKLLDKLMKAVSLGFINRLLGSAMGFLKLAVVTGLLVVLAHKADEKFNFIPDEDTAGSLFYERFYETTIQVFPYINFDAIREKVSPKDEDQQPGPQGV